MNNVWRRAIRAGVSAPAVELGRLVGLQCRYALITASINSLTGNLSPELLTGLVVHEVWTATQALAYIQRHPDEEQRAELLVALVPLIPAKQIHDVLPHIRETEHGERLAHVLVTLAEQLLDVERQELLREARTIAEQLPPGIGRAKILLNLASYLPNINVEEALRGALYSLVSFDEADHQERDVIHRVFRINDDLAWVIKNLIDPLVEMGLKTIRYFHNYCDLAAVLALIAPRLSDKHLEEAIAIARSCDRADTRQHALRSLLPYVEAQDRQELVAEALEEVRKLDGISQAVILPELAPYLTDPHTQQVLVLLRQSGMVWSILKVSPQILSALASSPLPALLPALVETARQKKSSHERALCLAALSAHFPEKDRAALQIEAFQAARSNPDRAYSAEALINIAPYLADDQRARAFTEALDAAHAIERWTDRTRVAEIIAAVVDADASEEQRALGQKLYKFLVRQKIMTAIAMHLPENEQEALLCEVLEDMRIIPSSESWLWSGDDSLLAQLLALGKLQEVFEIVQRLPRQQVNYRNTTADALEELIPQLATHGFIDTVLSDLLALISGIAEPDAQIAVLMQLLHHVSSDRCRLVLRDALAAARTINDEQDRVTTLVKLAPYLPEANRLAILATVIPLIPQIPEPYPGHTSSQQHPHVQITSELIPYLPQELLPEIMAILPRLELDEYDRADILELVAKHASASLVLELLREVDLVDTDFEWQWVDALFVRLIAMGNLDEATIVINARQDSYERAWLLMSLAAQMSVLERNAIVALALEESQSISNAEQRAKILAGLIPMLDVSDRRATIEALFLTVADIPKEIERAFVLGDIAQYITENAWPDALARALSVTDGHSQSIILTRFIPHLPNALLGDAIHAARALPTAEYRWQALTGLAPRLSGDARDEILEEALIAALDAIEAEKTNPAVLIRQNEPNFEHPRCSFAALLIDLTSQLAPSSRHDALSVAQEMTQPNCKAEALVGLTALLPQNVLSEFIDTFRTLQHESFRAQALVAVVPDLPEALLNQVLIIANDIENASLRARVIGSVSARMQPGVRDDMLVEMLGVARGLEQPSARAAVLVELAPYLSPGLLQEALLDAREISAPDSQAYALVRMIPYVLDIEREILLAETLDIAVTTLSYRWRVETLTLLAPQLARLPRATHYPLLCEGLDKLAHISRSDLLANLRALTPSIAALGGQTTLTAMAEAVVEVGRWFP